MKQIPFTADLLTTSGMQLAMLVQPLALPHPSEEPIQVLMISFFEVSASGVKSFLLFSILQLMDNTYNSHHESEDYKIPDDI